MKILLVSHNPTEIASLTEQLTKFGWIVDTELKPEIITFAIKTTHYDAIVVSWYGTQTRTLIRSVRQANRFVPLLICIDSPFDRCHMPEVTWCDIIRKPYKAREVVGRVLLLTHECEQARQFLQCRDLVFDQASRRVTHHGAEVLLPRKESQLLEILLRRKNCAVSRSEIHESVWERDRDPIANAIDVHIGKLRKRLRDKKGELIKTVYGVGYMISD